MSDITELERRITSAMDRIGAAIERTPSAAPAGDSGELDALRDALEAEKTANAQLEERVRALHEKQDASLGEIEARVERLRDRVAQQERDLQRMKQVNAELRSSNNALRAANETGVGDAHLVNKAMLAELESLRATQQADRSELDAVLSELKPIVEESA